MAPTKIMIIRHGEKPPTIGGPPDGVGEAGASDADDLIVRGWQRAGALARFFAPLADRAATDLLQKPAFIVAAGIDADSASKRPSHTIGPLAALLGVVSDTRFAPGQETAAATAILAQDGVGLVCWEHHNIKILIGALTQGTVTAPHWDGDRFDMVLVLDAMQGRWTLTQVHNYCWQATPPCPSPPTSHRGRTWTIDARMA